jgi:Uma2 family endonuclease
MSTEVPVVGAPAIAAPPVIPPATSQTRPAVVIDGRVRIPAGIDSLEAFRRWIYAEEPPQGVRLSYLAGTLWVELTMEQYYTHNQVKAEVDRVLGNLAREAGQGRYSPDGMHLSNPKADLSTVPDGLFVSYEALMSGRVVRVPGRRTGVVDLEGSPEMVLEVFSDSSVGKDEESLPQLYALAGIAEFWRIDARGELRFEILRLTEGGYVPAQEPDGWWSSAVFARSFRLTQQPDPLGEPLFTLEVRQ